MPLYRSNINSPLDANPIKYRSRENSPSWLSPLGPYLIGWYKFDEGAGTVVNNYATDGSGGGGLLPNLAIVGLNAFWTATPGFGKKSTSTTQDFAWNKPLRTIGATSGWSRGAFLKMTNIGGGGVSTRAGDVITSGISTGIQIVPIFGDTTHTQMNGSNGVAGSQATVTTSADVWLFHFVADDAVYRVIQPNGTMVVAPALPGGLGLVTVNYLLMGFQYAAEDPPITVAGINPTVFGDWILYNNITLTLADWADWYDTLRGRYGMAARSGW